MNIGEKIKYFRKQKGLTIKELSSITNLSIGFISNLERDFNSPSISNLQQICEALDVNLIELMGDNASKSVIIKKDHRQKIFKNCTDNISFELITDPNKPLTGVCSVIKENSDFCELSWGHNYDEVGVIIQGQLEIEINNKTNILKEGDSVYIEKFSPHRYKNPFDIPCICYWFSCKA